MKQDCPRSAASSSSTSHVGLEPAHGTLKVIAARGYLSGSCPHFTIQSNGETSRTRADDLASQYDASSSMVAIHMSPRASSDFKYAKAGSRTPLTVAALGSDG